jgi:hypothetical protein
LAFSVSIGIVSESLFFFTICFADGLFPAWGLSCLALFLALVGAVASSLEPVREPGCDPEGEALALLLLDLFESEWESVLVPLEVGVALALALLLLDLFESGWESVLESLEGTLVVLLGDLSEPLESWLTAELLECLLGVVCTVILSGPSGF